MTDIVQRDNGIQDKTLKKSWWKANEAQTEYLMKYTNCMNVAKEHWLKFNFTIYIHFENMVMWFVSFSLIDMVIAVLTDTFGDFHNFHNFTFRIPALHRYRIRFIGFYL